MYLRRTGHSLNTVNTHSYKNPDRFVTELEIEETGVFFIGISKLKYTYSRYSVKKELKQGKDNRNDLFHIACRNTICCQHRRHTRLGNARG
jgi:hypothetical protein